jgi:hypothetical protein
MTVNTFTLNPHLYMMFLNKERKVYLRSERCRTEGSASNRGGAVGKAC